MDIGLLLQTGLFGEIFPFYLWTCTKWDNIGLIHLQILT